MATRKVLTINIEFELGDRKVYAKRLKAVYDAATIAATSAAERELLQGGIAEVRHRMTFDYRWADQSSATPVGPLEEWEDDPEQVD